MMGKMTKEAAERIQSSQDKAGGKDGFKERVQSVADKNSKKMNDTQSDEDNHSDQLNPNNDKYQAS